MLAWELWCSQKHFRRFAARISVWICGLHKAFHASNICADVLASELLLLPPLLHPFNGLLSRTTWMCRYQKGKTSLLLNEARDDGALGCSGISRTICKQSAPHSRRITTPTHHHSVFTGQMLFLQVFAVLLLTEGYTRLSSDLWFALSSLQDISHQRLWHSG